MFNKGEKLKKRFKQVLYEQQNGTFSYFTIICDTETGVNYLFYADHDAGGITVLLDKKGKPVITNIES